MIQESLDALIPWFEWVEWKQQKLVVEKRLDLAMAFHRDVMKVLRIPMAYLVVAAKKADLPATSSLGTTRASHPIQEWIDVNPDPLRETLAAAAALRERWGDKTMMPAEPVG